MRLLWREDWNFGTAANSLRPKTVLSRHSQRRVRRIGKMSRARLSWRLPDVNYDRFVIAMRRYRLRNSALWRIRFTMLLSPEPQQVIEHRSTNNWEIIRLPPAPFTRRFRSCDGRVIRRTFAKRFKTKARLRVYWVTSRNQSLSSGNRLRLRG